jgi:Family of unknown function (DUF5309)
MAVITNTFTTASPKGNRESLSDVVSRITPEDTPIYSMIPKETANATFEEWEIDTLNPPAANAQLEGDAYAFDATTPVVRVGAPTQIMRRSWIVTKTQEAIRNAGNVEKVREVKLKRGIEIRKDTELAIVTNTASVRGQTRLMGGLPSWLTSNVSRGAAGANGGYSSGTTLTVAETTGTQRAFTQALLDATMQACYISGAMVKNVVVSPFVKSVFVGFMSNAGVATFRYAVRPNEDRTVIATADYYEGPFGRVAVIPNRVMASSAAVARRAFLLDDDLLSMKVLRKISSQNEVVPNADAEAGMILGEHTLAVKNEAGQGVIADLFGLTAAS